MNFKAFSILSLLVLSPAFSGCSGGSGNSPTAAADQVPVNVAGTWRGTVNSTVSGSNMATLRLNQYSSNLTALNGTYSTYSTSYGKPVPVPITGNIHGTTANFTITKTGPGCSGSYSGAGIVTIFPNKVKTMGYTSSVASNAACVGNESLEGTLTFANYSGPN